MGSCCDEFLLELGVEVRPRQASMLAYVVLAGTSEGIAGPRVLRELVVGVAAPSDLTRSIIVEILHSGECGDVEQVLEPRNNSPVFAIALLYLSLSLICVYILHVYIVYFFYMLDILVLN